jgi:hypothetical protein
MARRLIVNKRPRASHDEVMKKIAEIQDYHEEGRKSLKRPPSTTVQKQADALGWNITRLRKARQFARAKSGYSQARLEELCDLLEHYGPIFGTAHIGLLVTVSWPEREEIQRECIEGNWSVLDLKTALKARRDSRSAGGRHRKVAPDDVLVRLEDVTTTWRRLRAALRRCKNGQPSPRTQLSLEVRALFREVHVRMMKLRRAVRDDLAPMRE